ncbi:MAG: class I SAM-dependent methyltransferase [Elusimicrobiota bacterium]|nr:class I SAM-dependent methyltransferase [Elusimicrobiota bacterium]
MAEPACPLCSGASRPFHRSDRDFLRCGTCALTFVPAAQHLSSEAERARYASHRNSPEDAGYRAFLDRLLSPLAVRLTAGARGLDFGSGPGPTASVMMRERGFVMTDYDPFFASDDSALSTLYDFLVCTEVLEHLRSPAHVFQRLDALIAPGGLLGVMTGVLEDDAAFPSWWYHKDPTHIAFYRAETLSFIARRFGWTLERPSRDAALFRKPG